MKRHYVGFLALLACSAQAAAVFHAKDHAQVCSIDGSDRCETVDGSVLMQVLKDEGDVWRVRVPAGAGFSYYSVRRDEIEPARDEKGRPITSLCMPFGGGGVVNRMEVGPNGQLFLKRYLVTVTCKDGKSYSTTKPLN